MPNKLALEALAREQLKLAAAASSGRSAETVFGGHERVLRQTLIALTAGTIMGEHESPGEATLLVIVGRVQLAAGHDHWEGRAGDFIVIPQARHSVEALEDAAVLLTVAQGGAFEPHLAHKHAHADASMEQHTDLGHVHAALAAAYDEVLTSPLGQVEGLDRAACGPHMKHFSELAAHAAARGISAEQWRSDVLNSGGPSVATALEAAETCMRQSGLWPWNAPGALTGR